MDPSLPTVPALATKYEDPTILRVDDELWALLERSCAATMRTRNWAAPGANRHDMTIRAEVLDTVVIGSSVAPPPNLVLDRG